MKKNVLREYLKNREKKTLTIRQDKYFTFEVDDAKATVIEVKPKKKAKKGDK